MKLIFDATELSYYNDNTGHKAGVYNVAYNLLKELKKKGLNISLYCDYKRYYFFKQIDEFKDFELLQENSIINKFLGKLIFLLRKAPIRIQYLIIIFARFYEAYFYISNNKNIEQFKKFDVYFSPFTPPSQEINSTDIKRFRMIHDVIPILEKGLPKTPKYWYYRVYQTLNEKDFYITNSEWTKQDLLKYFPFIKKTHVKTALLGANENFYPTNERIIDENYIFSLCSLGKRKNLTFAIKNFYKFIEKHNIQDLKLVLSGAIWEKYKKELFSYLNHYDTSKIILTGYVKDEDLKKYYSNALCLIYPSLYEGFGLPVLEAMQCGCPVITSNKSSLPEVINDCGIMIDPESNEEIIKAFEQMYFDKTFRHDCSNKGIERAKLFSWNKCANEILDFIKSTV